MFTRILSSAAIGIAVTAGLLFLMQFLIATGEEIIIEPRERSELIWIALETDELIIVDPPVFQRPKPPPIPPRTEPFQPEGDDGIGFKPPGPPPPIPAGEAGFQRLNFADGPLVSIIKVKPVYPAGAVTRGLEGTVLVQFDITTLGTVANVVVIDSTHSVFNKAAVAAVYRFRYKPRMVDGIAYETKGLRNLFRFRMEK